MTFFAELKRRNVIRMAGLYLVGGWLIIQIAETMLPAFDVPGWVLRAVIILLALGFIPALVFSWVFELTAEGIKRDSDVTAEQSVASTTGRRMDRLIVAGLLAVIAVVAADRYWPSEKSSSPAATGIEALPGDAAPASDAAVVAEAVAAVDANSIAVLPFVNLSGQDDQEYFSDGMTEELLNVLARNTGLRIAARTSVFAFKGESLDVRKIGEQLGVAHIVEGSVRRDGEQVRIGVQLIRVADGFQVWAETFDRRLESIFALQDEIANAVAAQMASSLSVDQPAGRRGDIDPIAFDHYLQGRKLLRERRTMLTAIGHFRSAVKAAPEFAAAWAGLSLAIEVSPYLTTGEQQRALGERLPQMRDAAKRAESIDPRSALTLHALANLARADGRLLDAESLYRRAAEVDPTYSAAREDYTELLSNVGKSDEALTMARELVILDPLVPAIWYRVAAEGVQRDRADVTDLAKAKMAEINAPYFYNAMIDFRRAYYHGRSDAARAVIDAAYRENPEAAATDWLLFRWSQDDSTVDDQYTRQLINSRYGLDDPMYVGQRGDADFLFQVMAGELAIDKRYHTYYMLSMPSMAHYLSDDRAKQLLRDAGFEAFWRARGWPENCRPIGDDDFACGPEITGNTQ